jgi:hypothetical protein
VYRFLDVTHAVGNLYIELVAKDFSKRIDPLRSHSQLTKPAGTCLTTFHSRDVHEFNAFAWTLQEVRHLAA